MQTNMTNSTPRSTWRHPFSSVARPALLTLAVATLAGAITAPAQSSQSPVDFNHRVIKNKDLPKVRYTYLSTNTVLRVQNTFDPNGTNGVGGGPVSKVLCTIKANVNDPNAGKLTVNRRNYYLLEFHFHTPAEHTVDKYRTAMEVHFVFADAAKVLGEPDSLLVVGAWIVPNSPATEDNPELAKIFSNLPTTPSYVTVSNFNLRAVLPSTGSTFRYPGSLTSPAALPGYPNGVASQITEDVFPEIVSWVVSDETIGLSNKQIEAYQALFPEGDARKTYPLGQRQVLHDKKPREHKGDNRGDE